MPTRVDLVGTVILYIHHLRSKRSWILIVNEKKEKDTVFTHLTSIDSDTDEIFNKI